MRKRAKSVWVSLTVTTLAVVALSAASAHAKPSSTRSAWLGVYMQGLTDDLREGLDYKGEGVLVSRVEPDSPADRAGIEKGDVIVSINSHSVEDPADVSRIVRGMSPDQTATVVIMRDGSRKTITTKLAERPEDLEEYTPEPPEPPEAPEAPVPAMPRIRSLPRIEMPEGDLLLQGMGRGRLGVRVESLNPDLGNALGAPEGKGVLVVEVMKGTPAERAGLKAGDVITRVGDRAVYDTDDLRRALDREDEKVSLSVSRKGVRRTVEAELDKAPRAYRYNLRRGEGLMGRRDGGDMEWRVIPGTPDMGPRDDMRRELQQLRDELKKLRDELNEMKRN